MKNSRLYQWLRGTRKFLLAVWRLLLPGGLVRYRFPRFLVGCLAPVFVLVFLLPILLYQVMPFLIEFIEEQQVSVEVEVGRPIGNELYTVTVQQVVPGSCVDNICPDSWVVVDVNQNGDIRRHTLSYFIGAQGDVLALPDGLLVYVGSISDPPNVVTFWVVSDV
ncbi:MAG: hypothetical protein AAF125_03300 [Chloroflexota bacterium]